jgi:hypothetical protein
MRGYAPPSRIAWIVGGLLIWAGWVAFAVLPEWRGSRDDGVASNLRIRERDRVEAAYGAGWLTTYLEEHNELPAIRPPNRAAAANRELIELCPTHALQLLNCEADWALCSAEERVRALSCTEDGRVEDGGWQFTSMIPEPPKHLR